MTVAVTLGGLRTAVMLAVTVAVTLGVTLGAGASLASAQDTGRTPDGQAFEAQSQATRQAFEAMYGPSCASQEWLWQHALALDPSLVSGPSANDGQQLSSQDDDVQLVFVAVWGPAAATEWVAEHNAIIGHRVLSAPVAPIPCPAARQTRGLVIDATHIEDAVAAAEAGNLPEAHANLNQFRDLFISTREDIRRLSPEVADRLQAAYDQAAAVISDPRRPTPRQTEYLPVLQNLLSVVQRANEEIGR